MRPTRGLRAAFDRRPRAERRRLYREARLQSADPIRARFGCRHVTVSSLLEVYRWQNYLGREQAAGLRRELRMDRLERRNLNPAWLAWRRRARAHLLQVAVSGRAGSTSKSNL